MCAPYRRQHSTTTPHWDRTTDGKNNNVPNTTNITMKRINKWALLLTASYCVLAVGCKDDEGSYLVLRNRCHPVFEQSGLFAAHHAALQRRMALGRTRRCPVALDDSFGGRRYGRIRMDHRFGHAQPLGRTHSNALLGMQRRTISDYGDTSQRSDHLRHTDA